MITPKLFAILPEEYVSTPDSMSIHKESGDLVLSCPNYADEKMPGCVLRIDRDRKIRKWYDVPTHPQTGAARNMGIEFGPDGYLYICDNQGWSGREELMFKGRILKVKADDEGNILDWKTVASGMEHPNGIRFWGEYMYVTQSCLSRVKTPSGKLMSCVYKFHMSDENIAVANTLEDKNIFETFITENPICQYGVDGIVFDARGNLYVGNFGDGAVHKLTLDANGNLLTNTLFAQNRAELKSTDGMITDDEGSIYVADFSANAIGKIYSGGRVERIAQSPDCDGLSGGLNQPGEPIIWNGMLIASCFDLVTDDDKVNTQHTMPATLSMLEL